MPFDGDETPRRPPRQPRPGRFDATHLRLARRGRTVAFVIHYTSRKAADEAYREYRRESRAGCLSFIVRFKKLQHVFSIVPDQSTPTMDWRRIVLAALSGAVAIRGLIALVHLFL